jgi:2-keto-4-pentenoate hydratase/2-oxohepta-3-ene-1,7-dioic acid hydratase in catechol pathway
MYLASIRDGDRACPAVVSPGGWLIAAEDVGAPTGSDAMALLDTFSALAKAAQTAPGTVRRPPDSVRFAPPYLRPRKIWGIGLNYAAHAADLSAKLPEDEPASFIKGDHTIIGPGDRIELPPQSRRVTAEAELGLVIGRLCRNVSEADALDYVWGVCAVLDQTAEDILQRNPRFLTRSKNFPTFFSFGPCLVPMAEATANGPLEDLVVSTVRNGVEERTNTVSRMTFGPRALVSFHSHVMPLFPGDIISTGTPGAVEIRDGDVVECRVTGLAPLRNEVVRWN